MGKNCTDFILSFFIFLRRRWYFRSLEGLAAVEGLDAVKSLQACATHRALLGGGRSSRFIGKTLRVGDDFVLPCLSRHRSKIRLQIQFCCHDLSVNYC